ncbi:MAG: hypothetical protein EOL89_00080 [Actinobacteria bacterium]|nr:hypothetical protein [Actinomycetota bacterium]
MLVVGGLAVLAVAVGAFALSGVGSDDVATQPTQPAANAVATVPAVAAEQPVVEPTPAPSPEVTVPAAPQLSGCWDVEADAAGLASYAAALGTAASSPVAISQFDSSLAAMEGTCGVVYTTDVAVSVARQPGIPGGIQEAADSYVAARVRFPAPDGSLVRQRIDSPEKNISCELEESSVGCSILERSYPVAEDCPDRLFSAVLVNGDAEKACGTQWLGEVGDDFYHIDYGETVQFGFMACTVEADGPRRGMTCWDTRTGHSLRLSRALFQIDNTL